MFTRQLGHLARPLQISQSSKKGKVMKKNSKGAEETTAN